MAGGGRQVVPRRQAGGMPAGYVSDKPVRECVNVNRGSTPPALGHMCCPDGGGVRVSRKGLPLHKNHPGDIGDYNVLTRKHIPVPPLELRLKARPLAALLA